MSRNYFFDNDGDFDALSLVKIAWEHKIPILLLSFLTAIGAAFYSQYLDEKWTATTTLMPVEAAEAGPAGAGASALVGLVGVSLGGASGVGNAQIAQELIVSRDFFKRLIEKDEQLLIDLIAIERFKNGEHIYNPELYDINNKKWISKPDFFPAFRTYRRGVDLQYSWDMGGFIKISFSHKSPVFAAHMLETIIEEVNSLKKERDIKQADDQLEFLILESKGTTNSDLKRAISGLMQNQLKSKMFATTRIFYIVEPMDSVYQPALRAAPNKPLFVIIWAMISFALSFLFFAIKRLID